MCKAVGFLFKVREHKAVVAMVQEGKGGVASIGKDAQHKYAKSLAKAKIPFWLAKAMAVYRANPDAWHAGPPTVVGGSEGQKEFEENRERDEYVSTSGTPSTTCALANQHTVQRLEQAGQGAGGKGGGGGRGRGASKSKSRRFDGRIPAHVGAKGEPHDIGQSGHHASSLGDLCASSGVACPECKGEEQALVASGGGAGRAGGAAGMAGMAGGSSFHYSFCARAVVPSEGRAGALAHCVRCRACRDHMYRHCVVCDKCTYPSFAPCEHCHILTANNDGLRFIPRSRKACKAVSCPCTSTRSAPRRGRGGVTLPETSEDKAKSKLWSATSREGMQAVGRLSSEAEKLGVQHVPGEGGEGGGIQCAMQ